MAKNKPVKKIKLSKKVAKYQVIKVLEHSLGDLQHALGDKKFNRRIKKASRMLSTGLPKAPKDRSIKTKKIILSSLSEEESGNNKTGSIEKENMMNGQA